MGLDVSLDRKRLGLTASTASAVTIATHLMLLDQDKNRDPNPAHGVTEH